MWTIKGEGVSKLSMSVHKGEGGQRDSPRGLFLIYNPFFPIMIFKIKIWNTNIQKIVKKEEGGQKSPTNSPHGLSMTPYYMIN